MKRLKNPLQIVLSIALLALFIWLLLRGVDLQLVKQSFVKANWRLIALSFVFMPLSLLVRALRWRYLLCAYQSISFKNVYETTCVTRLLANVLPFRAADVLQGVMLGKKEGVHSFGVLASVLAERIIDLLFLVIFFAILSMFTIIPETMKHYVYLVVAAIFGGFFVVIYTIDSIERIVGRLSPLIAEKIRHFKPGINAFKNMQVMMIVSSLTLASWIVQLLFTGMVLIAFGIPFVPIMLIAYLVVPALACIIPSTPGFIGVWDYAAVSTLTTYGVDKSLALGATAFVHVYGLLATSVFGLYYIGKGWLFNSVSGTIKEK